MQATHQGVSGFRPAIGLQLAAGFRLGPFGEIGAGAEAAAAAGQHHHAHGGIAVAGIELGMQGFQGGDVQRVALLRAVQADPGDAAFDPAGERGNVSHAALVLLSLVVRSVKHWEPY
ncbi:hypothetical protein D3C76_1173700 [compost metagenome]